MALSGGSELLFEDVSLRFPGPIPTLALDSFRLEVNKNEFVAVLGPSGCGKSTLLRVAGGLLQATSGRVIIAGTEILGPPQQSILVFQDYSRSLLPWRSVWRNVSLGLHDSDSSSIREEARHYLEMVALGDVADKYPRQLSGGMQQRVALARALARKPQVLLMDEPLGSIDAYAREQLQDMLRDLWNTLGLTIVFVTHDVDEAVYLATRLVVMTKGPGRVLTEIPSSLPAMQRDQDRTRASSEFRDLRLHVRGALREAAE
jgi:NitT/TauT family transport system ATP-binding protein